MSRLRRLRVPRSGCTLRGSRGAGADRRCLRADRVAGSAQRPAVWRPLRSRHPAPQGRCRRRVGHRFRVSSTTRSRECRPRFQALMGSCNGFLSIWSPVAASTTRVTPVASKSNATVKSQQVKSGAYNRRTGNGPSSGRTISARRPSGRRSSHNRGRTTCRRMFQKPDRVGLERPRTSRARDTSTSARITAAKASKMTSPWRSPRPDTSAPRRGGAPLHRGRKNGGAAIQLGVEVVRHVVGAGDQKAGGQQALLVGQLARHRHAE